MGVPGPKADLTFHLGFLHPFGAMNRAGGLGNSFLTKVIFLSQAELQELEEIDSLCSWLFNQKKEYQLKTDNAVRAGGGERRPTWATSP